MKCPKANPLKIKICAKCMLHFALGMFSHTYCTLNQIQFVVVCHRNS